jgi:hypothetical protein
MKKMLAARRNQSDAREDGRRSINRRRAIALRVTDANYDQCGSAGLALQQDEMRRGK